ncbi:MAG: LamG domain-containing protein, partial [Planctomycetes bacterium]|nr:LamG domain-containing protein [Planctomycetota bacterium]
GTLLIGDNDLDALSMPYDYIAGKGDFSLFARIKFNTLHQNGRNCIISGARVGSDKVLRLGYQADVQKWIAKINEQHLIFDSFSAEEGTWYDLALIRNGSSIKLYLDCVLIDECYNVNTDALDLDPGGLIVGQEQHGQVGGGFIAFKSLAGELDLLVIDDGPWNEQEICEYSLNYGDSTCISIPDLTAKPCQIIAVPLKID